MQQDKINEDARFNIMKQSSLRDLIDINSRRRRGEISGTDAELMSQIIIETLDLQKTLEEDKSDSFNI